MSKKKSGDVTLYVSLVMSIIGGLLLLTLMFWGGQFTRQMKAMMFAWVFISFIASVFLFFLGWMLRMENKTTRPSPKS